MNTVLYFERSAVLRPSSLPATDPTSPLLAQRFSPPLTQREIPPTRYAAVSFASSAANFASITAIFSSMTGAPF